MADGITVRQYVGRQSARKCFRTARSKSQKGAILLLENPTQPLWNSPRSGVRRGPPNGGGFLVAWSAVARQLRDRARPISNSAAIGILSHIRDTMPWPSREPTKVKRHEMQPQALWLLQRTGIGSLAVGSAHLHFVWRKRPRVCSTVCEAM